MLTTDQTEHICRALLARSRQAWLWNETERRPSEWAWTLGEGKAVSCSSSERLWIRVALDVWNSGGRVTLGDMFSTFDGPNLVCLGALLVALGQGGESIDRWIDNFGDGVG